MLVPSEGRHEEKLSARSAQALTDFLTLNVALLDVKKYQRLNLEAARKILKKHDKRTALTAGTGLREFMVQHEHDHEHEHAHDHDHDYDCPTPAASTASALDHEPEAPNGARAGSDTAANTQDALARARAQAQGLAGAGVSAPADGATVLAHNRLQRLLRREAAKCGIGATQGTAASMPPLSGAGPVVLCGVDWPSSSVGTSARVGVSASGAGTRARALAPIATAVPSLEALLPLTGPGGAALRAGAGGRESESLAHILYSLLSTQLLPILPSLDDYSCAICLDVAWRPIRLDCQHLFCIRCLVKLQKQGRRACPLCRAPDAVGCAGERHLDSGMSNMLKTWFPREVRAKDRENERDRRQEERRELGFHDPQCSVM